jgi:CheY-like chemotaxis protein
VSAHVDQGDAVLRVEDNGMGIPPEMVGRVFDLFTQVERTEDGHQAGLGIGLTLVRRLVELHGGTVHAESDGPGQGSAFVVRLPLLGAQAAVVPSMPATSKGIASAFRILVVDDNRDAADTLRMLLEMEGHVVRMVHDGHAAVDAARDFEPEVVFLDIGLPGMDGFQVAARLRGQGRPMHLFAVTGWGAEDDRRRARESGFDDHLVKPVDTTRLLELLASIESPAAAT